MDNPEIMHINAFQNFLPYYPLTAGLTQNVMRQIILNALKKVEFSEELTQEFLNQYHIDFLSTAFWNLHFPESSDMLLNAKRSLGLREILLFLYQIRNQNSEEGYATPLHLQPIDQDEYMNRLPFRCTQAQISAIKEIAQDLGKSVATNRLIQGDVGSGKTVVALFAAFVMQKYGYQTLILVPTGLLAEQHYHSAVKLLGEEHVALFTGSMTEKEKKNLQTNIEQGKTSVLISTHAILYAKVTFPKLRLIIIDEQHRFGVAQRSYMANQYSNLHKITMSATPIPRSLAMILHGNAEITVLNELPPGRTPVKTYIVYQNKRKDMYDWINQKVMNGEKAYIVCSLLEASEGISAVSVYDVYMELKNNYPQIKTGIIHGRMKDDDKTEIMRKFITDDISILISTTVVEVGVDVPDATIMVIEDADRFGLAQLHQLRGRVGRGNRTSYCYLICHKSGVERLQTLKECHDGFEIAKKDLIYRGAGNFLGTEQHGEMTFRFVSLLEDIDLFEEAKKILHILPQQYPKDHEFFEKKAQEKNTNMKKYLAI